MSALLQFPVWEVSTLQTASTIASARRERETAGRAHAAHHARQPKPEEGLELYRKHTESLLRRYLLASTQVGRAPSILSDPVSRGWASSRPVKTFEDAIIFVLDVERCLNQLDALDREILCRVILQEYTQAETAVLLGMNVRSIGYRFPLALDRLTEKVLASGLLVLSD